MKIFFPVIVASILISSCATTKVKVNSKYSSGIEIDTFNLISTMIGPVLQPVFPLIDAAAFNEKTNRIADQILKEEQGIIEMYKSALVNNLKDKLQKPILTGSDFTSEAANQFKLTDRFRIDNQHFPFILFSDDDLNIVEFSKVRNVNSIFKNNPEIKMKIIKLASDLQLKTVLISYSRLNVVNVGAFGISGNLRLEVYLYLFDSNGNLMFDAFGWSKPTNINGKVLNEYKLQLNNFPDLSNLISQELLKYIR